MERTSTIEGDTPVLILAPHGLDDENTAILAEKIAKGLGAYAVINRGWKRSSRHDYWKDEANCNDVRHIHCEVVKEEFLDPILRFASRIKKRYEDRVFTLILHGCSDSVRKLAGDGGLDMVLGYGEGNPPSYSCRNRVRRAFAHYLQSEGFGVYGGASGGLYSGKSKNNLNQLFVKWYPDNQVDSLQLEIVRELRRDAELLEITTDGIISAIDSLMLLDDTAKIPDEELKMV